MIDYKKLKSKLDLKFKLKNICTLYNRVCLSIHTHNNYFVNNPYMQIKVSNRNFYKVSNNDIELSLIYIDPYLLNTEISVSSSKEEEINNIDWSIPIDFKKINIDDINKYIKYGAFS